MFPSVAAGAAGVHQRFVATCKCRGKIGVAWRRIAVAKPTSSSTVSPFMRSAVSSAAICASLALPGEDLLHRGFGFGAREIFALDEFFERFVNHVYCSAAITSARIAQSRLARSAAFQVN